MLSKQKIKFLNSLQRKKNRQQNGLFLLEGEKIVLEALESDFPITELYVSEAFYTAHLIGKSLALSPQIAKPDELRKAGSLVNNSSAIALAEIPPNKVFSLSRARLHLVLDGVQDPGNLGTILRLADWYGITEIICSEDTVEVYNPKVVAASMGAILRIKTFYTDLSQYLAEVPSDYPIYGALLAGDNLHQFRFETPYGLLIMGNESKGIRPEIQPFVRQALHIPRFGKAESLNVAMATAIFCDHWRQTFPK